MKQTFLVLVVLLIASPALARVDFDCTNDGNEVTVTWTVVADTNLVRAFALDVNCTADIDKNSFTGLDPNYWVYPGSIDVNEGGVVIGFGNPVCTGPNDGTELKSYTSTIEMGSLYKVGVEDPPLSSGIVCKFKVYTAGDFNVTLSENAIRAGVVMEDANNNEANLPQTWSLTQGCFPTSPAYASQYSEWSNYGKPDCWCGTDTLAVTSGFQCHGDASGVNSGFPYYYRVFGDDVDVVGDNWKLKASHWNSSDPLGTILGNLNPCADLTHKNSGFPYYYRVFGDDVDRMGFNWKAKNSNFTPGGADCPLTDAANNSYVDPTP